MSDLMAFILSRVATPRSDCLIWPDAVDRGYGRIWVDGRAQRVHRVVWELTNGPIPDGLTIDHLCRVRYCVNTDHMELVTPSENTRRRWKNGHGLGLAVGDDCSRGHHIASADQLYARSDATTMRCRECKREANRRRSEVGCASP